PRHLHALLAVLRPARGAGLLAAVVRLRGPPRQPRHLPRDAAHTPLCTGHVRAPPVIRITVCCLLVLVLTPGPSVPPCPNSSPRYTTQLMSFVARDVLQPGAKEGGAPAHLEDKMEALER